jgi:hypothetical protein
MHLTRISKSYFMMVKSFFTDSISIVSEHFLMLTDESGSNLVIKHFKPSKCDALKTKASSQALHLVKTGFGGNGRYILHYFSINFHSRRGFQKI